MLLLIERFFYKTVNEILALPISVYQIYSDQAINHLAASMGNKFETQIRDKKKDRLREKLNKLKEEAEVRKEHYEKANLQDN